jgi:uncharacterized protein (DUF2147 family)
MVMSGTIRAIGFALALVVGTSAAAIAAPVAITGNWITKDKDAVIKIAPCGAALCGTISKYLVTPPNGVDQRDDNNPDKSLRNRKLLGSAVLINFIADGDKWKGKIYDARNGKTYRSVVYKGKSGNLIVKGCIGPFCQSQTWAAAK